MTTLSSCSMLIPPAARLTPYLVLVIRGIQVKFHFIVMRGVKKYKVLAVQVQTRSQEV